MPKDVTLPAQTEADKQFGVEPITVIEIQWTTGTEYYGDKDVVIGAWVIQGKLIDSSTVNAQLQGNSAGDFNSIQVTLDDTDDDLHEKFQTLLIESTPATIYQTFEGLTEADATIMIKGKVYGEVVWSEESRTLSFNVEQSIEEQPISYSLSEDDAIIGQTQGTEGQAWPLGFGIPVHVPALRIQSAPLGTLEESMSQDSTEVDVERGEDFPQGVPITIKISAAHFEGTMVDTTFTFTAKNVAIYENVQFAERPEGDYDVNNPYVAWVDDPNVWLEGHYVIVNHSVRGWVVNFCSGQRGDKCVFHNPWSNDPLSGDQIVEVLMDENEVIFETAGFPRLAWATTYKGLISRTSPLRQYGATPLYAALPGSQIFWQTVAVAPDEYILQEGLNVKQVVEYQDTYVYNAAHSTQVLQVYGWRELQDERIFVPIPSSYYTLNVLDNVDGQNCSTISFRFSLEERRHEKWEGNVYVSYVSSISNNPARILKHIAETYTSLTVDATTFDEVRIKTLPFPCHFAYFNQDDALDFMSKVAFQARIALVWNGEDVKMTYLSEAKTPITIMDESETELKSLSTLFTSIDDLTTKSTVNFKTDYSGRELYKNQEDQTKKLIYENNIDTFGILEETLEMFIYTYEPLARMSQSFWGYRRSNSWLNVNTITVISNFNLNSFDPIAYAIAEVSNNVLDGEVRDSSTDQLNLAITMRSELASFAGNADSDGQPINDPNYFIGDPNNPVDPSIIVPNPCAGCAEVDYIPDTDVGPTGDGDSENPGECQTVFTTEPPDIVNRGEDFTITIELQNGVGQLQNIDRTATLTLVGGDPNDGITPSAINFTDGVFTGDVQVNGGDTVSVPDFSEIRVTVDGGCYPIAFSKLFEVIEAAHVLTCNIPPTVDRGVPFAFSLSGGIAGIAGEVLNVHVNIAPLGDVLVLDSNDLEITTITLDGGGNYAENWRVFGGTEDAVISVSFTSGTQNVAVNNCGDTLIEGISSPIVSISDSFGFTDNMDANSHVCEMIVPVNITETVAFALVVRVFAYDDLINPDPTFNGTAKLTAVDVGNGNAVVDLANICGNMDQFTGYVIVDIEDGVWICDSLTIDNVTGPILFTSEVSLGGPEQAVTACSDQSNILIPSPSGSPSPSPTAYYVLELDDYTITRGVAVNLTICAVNADGSPDQTYVPTTDVSISLNDFGAGDSISPVTTDNTGWVDGCKTVAVTINGGTGTICQVQDISADDDILPLTGTISAVVGGAVSALVATEHALIDTGVQRVCNANNSRLIADEFLAQFVNNWATAQNNADSTYDVSVWAAPVAGDPPASDFAYTGVANRGADAAAFCAPYSGADNAWMESRNGAFYVKVSFTDETERFETAAVVLNLDLVGGVMLGRILGAGLEYNETPIGNVDTFLNREIGVIYSDSLDYVNGSGLVSAIPNYLIDNPRIAATTASLTCVAGSTVDRVNEDVGGWTASISLTIDSNFLANMDGEDLYIFVYGLPSTNTPWPYASVLNCDGGGYISATSFSGFETPTRHAAGQSISAAFDSMERVENCCVTTYLSYKRCTDDTLAALVTIGTQPTDKFLWMSLKVVNPFSSGILERVYFAGVVCSDEPCTNEFVWVVGGCEIDPYPCSKEVGATECEDMTFADLSQYFTEPVANTCAIDVGTQAVYDAANDWIRFDPVSPFSATVFNKFWYGTAVQEFDYRLEATWINVSYNQSGAIIVQAQLQVTTFEAAGASGASVYQVGFRYDGGANDIILYIGPSIDRVFYPGINPQNCVLYVERVGSFVTVGMVGGPSRVFNVDVGGERGSDWTIANNKNGAANIIFDLDSVVYTGGQL